ncbi:MAG: hypothetical protein JXR76_08680 [Deltaproteobacteria bacterium]|nr:hypothetical protein [Deltaproteobacteria bacterium]
MEQNERNPGRTGKDTSSSDEMMLQMHGRSGADGAFVDDDYDLPEFDLSEFDLSEMDLGGDGDDILPVEMEELQKTVDTLAVRAITYTPSTLPPPVTSIVVAAAKGVDSTLRSVTSAEIAGQEKKRFDEVGGRDWCWRDWREHC